VEDYGFKASIWKRLRAALKADKDDALLVVWGEREDVDTAIREFLERARDALIGVPSETRQAFADRTTGLERILPGPERMYPDTDTPPIPVPDAWVETIEASLPDRPWEREAKYEQKGLSPAAAARLAGAAWEDFFGELSPKFAVTARRLASALERRLVHHWRASRAQTFPPAERIAPLVAAMDGGRLRPEAFDRVFDRLLGEPAVAADRIVAAFLPSGEESTELVALMSRLIGEKSKLRPLPDAAVLRWAMGRAMPGLLGRVDPAVVRKEVTWALDIEDEEGASA